MTFKKKRVITNNESTAHKPRGGPSFTYRVEYVDGGAGVRGDEGLSPLKLDYRCGRHLAIRIPPPGGGETSGLLLLLLLLLFLLLLLLFLYVFFGG